MWKKVVAAGLIGIMVALSASGCQSKNAAGDKGANIYYSAMESGDYYEGWAAQLQEQAEKAGAEFDVGYAENSIETQNEQIKDAVSGGCDVLLCGPLSADIVNEIKASAKEKPIVFINNAPEDKSLEKDRYIYVASDEVMAGRYQAEYILEKLKDKDEINVAILKGNKGASGTDGRTKGLKETLETSGKKINYVFEDYANWSTDTAKEKMGMFLNTGISVDCVVGNNDDMAIGGYEACKEGGLDTNSILFLGVDASANGCQAIVDGKMDFTVYQAMSEQMVAAIEAAKKMANGESLEDIEGITEDGKYILIPFEKVDADNVKKYM